MVIKAECPFCHRKQVVRYKLCACGEEIDKSKQTRI